MPDAKRALAALYDAWATGDADKLDDVLTDDYVDHDPTPGFAPDKNGAKQFLTTIMGATKDVDMNVSKIIVDGDNAAAHWVMEWTQVGNFMGQIPADGKRLRLRGHDFHDLKDGRIAGTWHCEDIFGVMAQLGLVPQG